MLPKNNKTKMYLAITLVMIIIITAWLLNLKNSLNQEQTQKTQDSQWQQISNNFNQLMGDINQLKESLSQSPTTSATDLQDAAQISPDELEQVADRLKVKTENICLNLCKQEGYSSGRCGYSNCNTEEKFIDPAINNNMQKVQEQCAPDPQAEPPLPGIWVCCCNK